jgi:CheY-like chemotaxis protein
MVTSMVTNMVTIEELEQALREALGHLYDPAFRPAGLLWEATGVEPAAGPKALSAALRLAIEDLRPDPNVPSSGRLRRLYDILNYRYLQNLTQEETAERLAITSRHLRREQQEATFLLAQRLLDARLGLAPRAGPAVADEAVPTPQPAQPGSAGTDEWRSQVKEELAALQRSAPGTVTEAGEALRSALELGRTLARRRDVELRLGGAPAGLVAAVHPSALRQLLLAALTRLSQRMAGGSITGSVQAAGEQVRILLTSQPASPLADADTGLLQELVAAEGGSLDVQPRADCLTLSINLPCVEEVLVLVVDDNLDLVHFYERYTAGTRYRIRHLSEPRRALDVVQTLLPDIIVLDIMLPDIDGWELLASLHEHPASRAIPVVICSVVREEELALALGAALYLPKPVRRAEFLEALERAARAATPA